MQADDAKKEQENQKPNLSQSIQASGMTAVPSQMKNPSLDYNEVWENLVQIGDHSNDDDDIVPEFNEVDQKKPEPKEKEPVKYDFAGNTFDEQYDD